MATENFKYDASSSKNIGDSIYIALRRNIVNLNLSPGEALNIRDISEKLNVSRTPVREALIKLGKEGLVDIVPQKGTSVSRIDLKRVEEEKFIRQSLEERVMDLFLQCRGDEDMDFLRNAVNTQKECLRKGDFLSFIECDDEFHRLFFLKTEKLMSWEIIRSMSGHYRRVRLMSLWDDRTVMKVIDQHTAIVEAISGDDLGTVLARSREHFTRINDIEQVLLKKYPHYFRESGIEDFLVKDFLNSRLET